MAQRRRDLILFPFNGNAREAVSVIQDINRAGDLYRLLGFVDDDSRKTGQGVGSYPVLGGREVFGKYPKALVLAVPGRPETYKTRMQLIDSLGIPVDRWATLIHPQARVGVGTQVGVNTLLMAGVTLTSNVSIGSHVVVLPNSVISHDSSIGDLTLVGSNVSISGGVHIGSNCYIGSGAKLRHEIVVGREAMIGLGAVVLADVRQGCVMVGNPARELPAEERA